MKKTALLSAVFFAVFFLDLICLFLPSRKIFLLSGFPSGYSSIDIVVVS